jgi:FHA domain-containing protein
VARYRLRFLHQEFDLPRGATIVGRSPDCHLTVEDPLVSRQHARIVTGDAGAYVEDLGSRNGVKVNGAPVRSATPLGDGDRVRIGTQDFVFCKVDFVGSGASKTTGVLRLCARCRRPYPREMAACPSCEATEQTDESDTLSGVSGGQRGWGVRLFVEAIDRALAHGRVDDAERLTRQATAQIEEAMAKPEGADGDALALVALRAAVTAKASKDLSWAVWVLDAYRRASQVPPLTVVAELEAVLENGPSVLDALGDLLTHARAVLRPTAAEEVHALDRLDVVRLRLEDSFSIGRAASARDGSARESPLESRPDTVSSSSPPPA